MTDTVPPEVAEYEAFLSGWMEEARSLRHRVSLAVPPSGSTAQMVMDALLITRGCLDRMDSILTEAVAHRGHSQRQADSYSEIAGDAWDTVAVNTKATTGADFMGPRERYSRFNLAVIEYRRRERQAGAMLSRARQAEEMLKIIHRGMSDTRSDLLGILRGLQFESHLER